MQNARVVTNYVVKHMTDSSRHVFLVSLSNEMRLYTLYQSWDRQAMRELEMRRELIKFTTVKEIACIIYF